MQQFSFLYVFLFIRTWECSDMVRSIIYLEFVTFIVTLLTRKTILV